MKSSAQTPKHSEKQRPVAPKAAAVAQTPWRPAWWHWVLGLLISTVVAFQVYGPALHGEFVFDDNYLPFLMSTADAPLRYWLGVRPFLMISYWLNYQSSGLEPYAYHAVNVLFHAANAVLIALIVRRALGWVGESGGRRETLAVFAGALFLLHPVQTESVAYVASRSEGMSVFFFLCAFAVFAYRRDAEISLGRSIAVLLLFGIACTVKEHTTVLPALLLLTDYFFFGSFGFAAIRRNWKLYGLIGLGAVAGVVAVVKVLSRAETAGFQLKEFTWYEYLFTQFRVIWLYLRLYVAPFGLNADYEFGLSRSILDGGAIIGLLGLLALAYVAWRYRREFPLAAFGYFGFLLLLAPTSSVVPIRDVAVERRLYLPFLCLLLITVDFVRRWKTTQTVLAGVLAAVSLFAGVLSYQRNHVWGSSLALWQDTVVKSPRNSRARFQLAAAQYQNSQCMDSASNYEQVSKMGSTDDRLAINWALALECANRPDEAVAKLQEAMKTQPSAHGYSTIGMIHGKRGRVDEALAALAEAEKHDPNFDMIFVYRGNIYASRGQMPMAAAEYRRALSINPKNPLAQHGLTTASQAVR